MSDDDKSEVMFSVRVFEGDLQDPLVQAKIFTNEMIRLLPEFRRQQMVQAKMMRVKYDSLISAGFDENQALWMCDSNR